MTDDASKWSPTVRAAIEGEADVRSLSVEDRAAVLDEWSRQRVRARAPLQGDLTVPGRPQGLGPSAERWWRVDVMHWAESWHATYLVADPVGCVADSYGSSDLLDVVNEVTRRIQEELATDDGCDRYQLTWRFAPDSFEEPEPAPLDWLVLPDLPVRIHASGEIDLE